MKVAAITITYNRLDLTKKTIESFYSKTKVDKHVFIDNGSTDGTQEYLKQYHHIFLEKNYGITDAFIIAAQNLTGYDFILKLDNDIETVTENIIERMLEFYKYPHTRYVVSPVDLNLDPRYAPHSFGRSALNGFNVNAVSHTGGAFQLIPAEICFKLIKEYYSFKQGDWAIGQFYRQNGYKPAYLTDFQMKHIGINQSSNNYIL